MQLDLICFPNCLTDRLSPPLVYYLSYVLTDDLQTLAIFVSCRALYTTLHIICLLRDMQPDSWCKGCLFSSITLFAFCCLAPRLLLSSSVTLVLTTFVVVYARPLLLDVLRGLICFSFLCLRYSESVLLNVEKNGVYR